MFLAASSGSRQCLMASWLFPAMSSRKLAENFIQNPEMWKNTTKCPNYFVGCMSILDVHKVGLANIFALLAVSITCVTANPLLGLCKSLLLLSQTWWPLAVVLLPNVCPNTVWWCFFCGQLDVVIVACLYDIIWYIYIYMCDIIWYISMWHYLIWHYLIWLL